MPEPPTELGSSEKPKTTIVSPREKNEDIESMVYSTIDVEAILSKLKSNFWDKDSVVAIGMLITKLRDSILDYDTIISDDASGRIPALIIKKIIDRRRQELGLPESIPISFIASGRFNNVSAKLEAGRVLSSFFEQRGTALGRALVVTEFIATGGTIERLAKIMENQGVDFQIAAVSASYDEKHYADACFENMICGKYSESSGAQFHSIQRYTGVRKIRTISDSGGIISAHPIKAEDYSPRDVRMARRDVKVLADALYPLVRRQ